MSKLSKPILFCGAMVRAIQTGQKTVTRRVIKRRRLGLFDSEPACYGPQWSIVPHSGGGFRATDCDPTDVPECDKRGFACPYPVGTRLWVKEAHYLFGYWRQEGITQRGNKKWRFICDPTCGVMFPDNPPEHVKRGKMEYGWFKRSSLFMPKWAARTWLEVVSVRPEHLQDITEADAMDEGVDRGSYLPWEGDPDECRKLFHRLWDYLHADDGCGFSSNPYVWRVEFRRV